MAKQDDKWFQEAVKDKKPNDLGGWSKTQGATTRRRKALSSRPRNWSAKKRVLSTARALQALANVTNDRPTKMAAKSDADYFYKAYKVFKKKK